MAASRAWGVFALLLAAAAAGAPPGDGPGAPGSGFDKFLQKTADVLTSDSKYFGQVHFPVIATNPNTGLTYGVLPVWLENNSRHEIRQIVAPMLAYNKVFGVQFSGSYYRYPTSHSKLRVILEKAQRSNQRAGAEYEDHGLFEDRATIHVEENVEYDGGARFYGTGPFSPRSSEASVLLVEKVARADMGVKFWRSWSAAAGWTVRRTRADPGPFPAPSALAPELRTTTAYTLPRLSVARDTRDLPFTPGSGSLTEVFTERSARALGSTADYGRYGGQWRYFLPQTPDLTAAMRVQTEWSGGGPVPFTALASLGGPRSLRAFAEGRFQDRGASLIGFEERWLVHSLRVAQASAEFQVAPFVEAGTVYRALDRAQLRGVATAAGVAFRAVVKPTVVGRVEAGVGREGPAIFVGIDYPF